MKKILIPLLFFSIKIFSQNEDNPWQVYLGANVIIQRQPLEIQENLVDFIVVGRPIYKASNPKNVVEEILKNI